MKKSEKVRREIVRRLDKSVKRLTQARNELNKALTIGKNSTWSSQWDKVDETEAQLVKARQGLDVIRGRFTLLEPTGPPKKEPEVLLG